jgi:DNA-binding response OmpR family regulator
MTGKIALVVDDEQHIVHVVALKLRNAGFEVVTASDGEQAYEIASKTPPDIVITDLQMPYMNGLELCQKLRENPATCNVPALMLTARGHALSKEDLASTNITEVLAKPFSPREILSRVETILSGGAAKAA